MRKNRFGKGVLILLCLLCLISASVGIYHIIKNKTEINKVLEAQEKTELKADIESPFETNDFKEHFDDLKVQNSDFIGWIKFDSELINLPILHSDAEDYYLRRDFNKEYSDTGSIYLDSKQELDNKNITLYGHYVYGNSKAMFSPLSVLETKEGYEANKIFRLYLENETRTYEICAVVKYSTEDTWYFNNPSYTSEEWANFVDFGENNKLYPTDINMDENGVFLTMQTCIRNNNSERLIVVGKLTNTD